MLSDAHGHHLQALCELIPTPINPHPLAVPPPAGKPSWDVFAEILERCNIVTTPGSGFGPAGEGFVRASAFGSRENILEAVHRFKEAYGSSGQ